MADFPPLSFSVPTHIRYDNTEGWVWGDEQSGKVCDWYYISSESISQVIFGLPPGGAMRHSDRNKTIYPSDIFYYILEGSLVLANPENGEVHRAEEGECVFFRRDTWHHAFNYSDAPLRILEFAAPPAGEAIEYAKQQANLREIKYQDASFLDAWPEREDEAHRLQKMKVIRKPNVLWQLWGERTQTLVGILASSEHLTVAELHLLPGQRTEDDRRGGEMSFFVLTGEVNLELPESGVGAKSFELKAWDGFYLPRNTTYRWLNFGRSPGRVLFQIVPGLT